MCRGDPWTAASLMRKRRQTVALMLKPNILHRPLNTDKLPYNVLAAATVHMYQVQPLGLEGFYNGVLFGELEGVSELQNLFIQRGSERINVFARHAFTVTSYCTVHLIIFPNTVSKHYCIDRRLYASLFPSIR